MLVQFPWPIQLNDFPPYAEQLGWTPTSRPTWFNVLPDNDYAVTNISSDRDGNVRNLFLPMASNETEDDEGAAELNDHFVSCVAAGREAWGAFPAGGWGWAWCDVEVPRRHVHSGDKRVLECLVSVLHPGGAEAVPLEKVRAGRP